MAGGMKLQSAATSGDGSEVNCFRAHGRYVLTVEGTGTIDGGTVQWEEAMTSGYAGTWRPLGDPITPVSGQLVTQAYEGPLRFVRARIADDITGGGTVSVWMDPQHVGMQ